MSPLAPDPKSPLGKARLLVVEGLDEFSLLIWLLEDMGIPGVVEIRRPYADVAPLDDYLEMLAAAPGIDNVTAIGIVCDAEGNAPGSVLDHVSSAFAHAFPGAPALRASGTFEEYSLEGRTVRMGAFIAPDGRSPGMLEDLCLSARFVQESNVLKCVDRFLDCLAEAEADDPHWSKRRLHAYIAACEDPSLKLGEAGRADYWHFEDPVWDPLKDFLRDLAVV